MAHRVPPTARNFLPAVSGICALWLVERHVVTIVPTRGESMLPTMAKSGDFVLVVRPPFVGPPQPGELAVAVSPDGGMPPRHVRILPPPPFPTLTPMKFPVSSLFRVRARRWAGWDGRG